MIIGFSIDSIEAGKDGIGGGETDINYGSSITGIEEAEVDSLDETIARIGFELALNYEQGGDEVAEMSFDGSVLWRGDGDDIIAQWDEDEELDEEVAAQVTNHIYRKCLTHAVTMADALELPSPVPMPRVRQ